MICGSLDLLLWTWGAICQMRECGRMRLGRGIRYHSKWCSVSCFSCSETCHSYEIGSVLLLPEWKVEMQCKIDPFTFAKLHLHPSGHGYVTVFIASSAYLSKSWMDKEASSRRTIAHFHILSHKLKLLLLVQPPACTYTHTCTHAEFGLAVNSLGNIICWGTAAGSLHRQNGRVCSLSQTQTTPNTSTHILLQGSAQRERLSILFVPPFLAPRAGACWEMGDPHCMETGKRDTGCMIQPRKQRIRT